MSGGQSNILTSKRILADPISLGEASKYIHLRFSLRHLWAKLQYDDVRVLNVRL